MAQRTREVGKAMSTAHPVPGTPTVAELSVVRTSVGNKVLVQSSRPWVQGPLWGSEQELAIGARCQVPARPGPRQSESRAQLMGGDRGQL